MNRSQNNTRFNIIEKGRSLRARQYSSYDPEKTSKNETVEPEDSAKSNRLERTVRKELIMKKILVIVTRKHLNSLETKDHETHDIINDDKSNCDT